MDRKELESLMQSVALGSVSPDEAVIRLARPPVAELGYATLDMHRGVRQGVGEVVYGEGKTPEQICGILAAMRDAGQKRILVTRVDADAAGALRSGLRSDVLADFEYRETAHVAFVGGMPEPDGIGNVVVACAGTSDLPVAEEASLTAEYLGSRVTRLFDVGVAGIHRLLSHADEIASASAIVAVAGMEGALASVVAGMASCPVIAVPTSVGYGASFGGVAALLSMLNSCASGVSVVNIDNGFGAGYQAALINHPKTAICPGQK